MRCPLHAIVALLAALLLAGGSHSALAACGAAPAASTDGALRFTGVPHTWGTVSSLGTPAAGDLVYDTTNNALSVCNGTSWQSLSAGGSASGSTGYVQFNNAGAFAAAAELFWDNVNKRLGIGTETPSDPISLSRNQAAPTQLKVENTSVLSGAETAITLGNGASTAKLSLYGSGTSWGSVPAGGTLLYSTSPAIAIVANNGAGIINFATGGASEKMRINASGNVGIGTTSPAQKLTVAGTIESTLGGIKFPDGTTQVTAASEGGPGCPTIGTITEPGTGSAGAACTDGSKFIGRYAGANYFATASDDSSSTGWNNAQTLCSGLNRHGYTDWFVPSIAVLQLMGENRVQIGGFSSGYYYWSSSGFYNAQQATGWAWSFYISYGDMTKQDLYYNNEGKVRCVRRS